MWKSDWVSEWRPIKFREVREYSLITRFNDLEAHIWLKSFNWFKHMYTFIHLFIQTSIYTFSICSIIHSFSLNHSFIPYWSINLIINESFIHLFLNHLLINYWIIHSFIHSFLNHSFIHSFLNHSFIHSFLNRSFIHYSIIHSVR